MAEHNEEGIYSIGNCASCHKSGNEHDLENDNNKKKESENINLKNDIQFNNKEKNEKD